MKLGCSQSRTEHLFISQVVQNQRPLGCQQFGLKSASQTNPDALPHFIGHRPERGADTQIVILDEQHRERVHLEVVADLFQHCLEQLRQGERLAGDFVDVPEMIQPFHDYYPTEAARACGVPPAILRAPTQEPSRMLQQPLILSIGQQTNAIERSGASSLRHSASRQARRALPCTVNRAQQWRPMEPSHRSWQCRTIALGNPRTPRPSCTIVTSVTKRKCMSSPVGVPARSRRWRPGASGRKDP